jgi:hypothetical protein
LKIQKCRIIQKYMIVLSKENLIDAISERKEMKLIKLASA